MPIYNYECPQCNGKKELLVRLDCLQNKNPGVRCDNCGHKMKRVMSKQAFHKFIPPL